MKNELIIPINQLTLIIKSALVKSNVSEINAQFVAEALVKAEIDGKLGHGISRVSSYSDQAKIGKVNGHAIPIVRKTKPGVISIDAANGFAYPSIDKLLTLLPEVALSQGIAMGGIHKSHHFGVAGHIVEKAAEKGMISILFGNTPSAIAPWRGNKALFGTNPIAFGAPNQDGNHLVIDLAVSKVARGKILKASQNNEKIPIGWALDKEGKNTDRPEEALDGTMLPFGGAKGSALALMIELLSAAVTGANFAYEADSFLDSKGNPPNVGQLMIMISPDAINSRKNFLFRMEEMIKSILCQENVYLPGSSRFKLREKASKTGVLVSAKVMEEIKII